MTARRKTTSRTPKRIIHQRLRADAHKDGTYWALFTEQRGRCGICEKEAAPTQRLDIDHSHTPPDYPIRGLLCRGCNMRLRRGMNPTWLRAAADYLERGSRDTHP